MSSIFNLGSLIGRRKGSNAAVPSVVPVPKQPPSILKQAILPRATPSSTPSISVSPGFFGGLISLLFYLSLIAMFVFLILVFVHFTITPIFKFDVNDRGLVDISAGKDGQLVWQNTFAESDAKATFENQLNCNYSISLDIFIKNQLSASTAPRVLLYRGESPVELAADTPASDILTLYNESNILVYLDPSKNDLNVVAITMSSDLTPTPEAIPPIPNVPVDTPFRLSILFQPGYMEVYMNGELQATRVFIGRPKETIGNFYGPPEFVREVSRVGNLQYWPRILAPSEVRSSGPVLPGPDFFVKKV
jgi:hypothetical protein